MTAKSWSEIESKVVELERENTELKLQLKTQVVEWNRQHEKRRKAQLQVARLEIALERACEMIVKATAANKGSTGCRVCPLFVPGRACIWFLKQGVNGCAEGLVKYFKEASQ
jgi:hypothetical protein